MEEKKNFIVTVYNQLSRSISSYVKFPAFGDAEYVVYNKTGRKLRHEESRRFHFHVGILQQVLL